MRGRSINRPWRPSIHEKESLLILTLKRKGASCAKMITQVSYSFILIFIVIGPGAYQLRSDFDSVKYIKQLDNHGTYLTIDNGHLNQRKQQYSMKHLNDNYYQTVESTASLPRNQNNQNISQLLTTVNTPGPGSYEINSAFVS